MPTAVFVPGLEKMCDVTPTYTKHNTKMTEWCIGAELCKTKYPTFGIEEMMVKRDTSPPQGNIGHSAIGAVPFVRPPEAQGLYDPQFEHDACGMGFVVHMKGQKSHNIVTQALKILGNMEHRGAVGAERNTGDGAGILIQLPHRFFQRVQPEIKPYRFGIQQPKQDGEVELPASGDYGVGMLFLPQDKDLRQWCVEELEEIIHNEGQTVLGWRHVPTDNSALGDTAISGEPVIYQLFIGKGELTEVDALSFERKLYIIRKLADIQIRNRLRHRSSDFYFCSLSTRTIVYKGMLQSIQVPGYFTELEDADVESAIAVIHSRFSTNTFPSWARAHPYRYLIHNGEINTIKGNANWMDTREGLFETALFGDDLARIRPIVDREMSDSGVYDNALEFLTLAGYSLPHAVMMTIPEPWQKHNTMSPAKKAFYRYHSCLMEPWDGPASVGFTDGVVAGAVLDRNGLRPSRYYITKDDLIVLASEVGVMEVAPEDVVYKGRLQPGRMLLVDTEAGRIISDEELKESLAAAKPYQKWLDDNMIKLSDLPQGMPVLPPSRAAVTERQHCFGYTFEDLRILLAPMAQNGKEALGSMGDDTPPAAMSDHAQPLYNYFKQLFAQVTNPPLDAIREELVTSSDTFIGSEGNLLDPQAGQARRIWLEHPVLTNEELATVRDNQLPEFKPVILSLLYNVRGGGAALTSALDALFAQASQEIEEGTKILILSDRKISQKQGAIPALLAAAGLHHYLIRQGTRTKVSLIVESGEPREVHHFTVLLGYGVDAINPYLGLRNVARVDR